MRILISDGMSDLDLTVDDDTDLDGSFVGTCNETGDRLRISGWLAESIDIVD